METNSCHQLVLFEAVQKTTIIGGKVKRPELNEEKPKKHSCCRAVKVDRMQVLTTCLLSSKVRGLIFFFSHLLV